MSARRRRSVLPRQCGRQGRGTDASAQLHLAAENSLAPLVHYQQDKVCCLATIWNQNCRPRDPSCRCAPRSPEILTSATGHAPSPIAAPTRKAAFKTDGKTTTHRPCRAIWGLSSGTSRILSTRCAVPNGCSSFSGSAAKLKRREWQNTTHAHQIRNWFLHVSPCAFERPGEILLWLPPIAEKQESATAQAGLSDCNRCPLLPRVELTSLAKNNLQFIASQAWLTISPLVPSSPNRYARDASCGQSRNNDWCASTIETHCTVLLRGRRGRVMRVVSAIPSMPGYSPSNLIRSAMASTNSAAVQKCLSNKRWSL